MTQTCKRLKMVYKLTLNILVNITLRYSRGYETTFILLSVIFDIKCCSCNWLIEHYCTRCYIHKHVMANTAIEDSLSPGMLNISINLKFHKYKGILYAFGSWLFAYYLFGKQQTLWNQIWLHLKILRILFRRRLKQIKIPLIWSCSFNPLIHWRWLKTKKCSQMPGTNHLNITTRKRQSARVLSWGYHIPVYGWLALVTVWKHQSCCLR